MPGSCGLGDIYFTRNNPAKGWTEPRNLGCAPGGPNTALDEQGPSTWRTTTTRSCSSRRSSAVVPGDIYVSQKLSGWNFGGSVPAAGLNDAGGERHPAERPQGRPRGRLLVEPGWRARRPGHLGRDARALGAPWSAPVNLGGGGQHCGSRDSPLAVQNARQLLFGRAPGPEGIGDIYVSTRTAKGADSRRSAAGLSRARPLGAYRLVRRGLFEDPGPVTRGRPPARGRGGRASAGCA